MPALARRAARRHRDDQRALALLEAELGQLRRAGTSCTVTPMRPAHDLALLELRQHVADGVDRHGEADADVARALRRSV